MAPFGSPSVPAGSSARLRQPAAGAPVSLRRIPSGFGLRYGLMADVNTRLAPTVPVRPPSPPRR